jgi:hypothetical protein
MNNQTQRLMQRHEPVTCGHLEHDARLQIDWVFSHSHLPVVVSAGQDGCRWRRLNLGEGGGRRVSVGEEKMEEMDGKGWKKLTALIFF